ncbi:MAG: helix-turn-helix domain-containing protein [Tissierellia bacterium]|nr:helix-turn-helix domain-containing protein [Tissierellia bacterium]
MRVSLPIISESLKRAYPSIKLIRKGQENIFGAQLWNPQSPAPDAGYLYICNASESNSFIDDIYDDMNFIIIGEPVSPIGHINHIVLPDTENSEDLLQNVQNVIGFIRNWHNLLLQSVVHKNDVQDLLEISYNVIKNPLLVFNPWRKTIASKNFSSEKYSHILKDLNGNFYLDFEMFKKTYGTDTLNRFDNIDSSQYFENKDVGYPYIVSNIVSESKRLALLVLIEGDTPIDNLQFLMCDNLAECIKAVLERTYYYDYKYNALDEIFFIDAVKGKALGENQSNYYLKQLGWKQDDTYIVLVIRGKEGEKSFPSTISFFRYSFVRMYSDIKIIVVDSSIVLIVNVESSSFYKKSYIDDFYKTLLNRNLICGISMNFDNFFEISTHYEQALYALSCFDTVKDREPLIYYENHILNHIIDTFSNSYELPLFLHPAVVKLIRHDAEYGSDLVDTIYKYLLNNKSYVACVDKLHIHRSTVVYRIKQIKEITNLDFDDEETKLSLLISIRMYYKANNLNHP